MNQENGKSSKADYGLPRVSTRGSHEGHMVDRKALSSIHKELHVAPPTTIRPDFRSGALCKLASFSGRYQKTGCWTLEYEAKQQMWQQSRPFLASVIVSYIQLLD